MKLEIHINHIANREWYQTKQKNNRKKHYLDNNQSNTIDQRKEHKNKVNHETHRYIQQLHVGLCLQLGTVNTFRLQVCFTVVTDTLALTIKKSDHY